MKRLTGLLNFLAIVSMTCIMTVALSDSANSAGKYKHPEPVSYTHLTLPTICSV